MCAWFTADSGTFNCQAQFSVKTSVVTPERIITLFATAKNLPWVLKGKLNQHQTSWDSGFIFFHV